MTRCLMITAFAALVSVDRTNGKYRLLHAFIRYKLTRTLVGFDSRKFKAIIVGNVEGIIARRRRDAFGRININHLINNCV